MVTLGEGSEGGQVDAPPMVLQTLYAMGPLHGYGITRHSLRTPRSPEEKNRSFARDHRDEIVSFFHIGKKIDFYSVVTPENSDATKT